MPNTSDERMKSALADWTAKNNLKSKESLAAPPANTDIKVEWYELPLCQTIMLGSIPFELTELSTTPQTEFQPVKFVCNSPAPLFVIYRSFTIKSITIVIPSDFTDSYESRSGTNGLEIYSSKLKKDDSISVSALYTGLVPDGFTEGSETYFVVTFIGKHTIVSSSG